MKPALVWSSGGGVQSTALACLIAKGDLPRPDYAVIADTGREASTTWSYLREHVQPLLSRTVGLEVEVAPHSLAAVDLYSTKGSLLIPAFTNHSGKMGQLPGYCSVEWKRRVVRRWLKQKGVRKCVLWLGISLDEVGRAKPSDVAWLEHAYPLLDLNLRRKDCLRLIEEAGLPPAPKSSCWMCPYRGPKEWAALTEDDRDKALTFEADIQAKDPSVFLRRNGTSVATNWTPTAEPAQNGLFGEVTGCDGGGYCWS